MFSDGSRCFKRENIHNAECKLQLNTMLYETVQCIRVFLKNNHRLTITDMWQEMAAHFSWEAIEAKIVHQDGKVDVHCSTTHGRTSKKWHGSSTPLSYSVQAEWKWLRPSTHDSTSVRFGLSTTFPPLNFQCK